MTMTNKVTTVFLAGVIGLVGMGASERFAVSGSYGFISGAEARVGRPLTPVSVAGVARRTVRRCAVGVYYC
ncbi:conserved hypothetical protein [Mesorhizobium prunaredense]|uniref:Uncharacterized protein n=1 Tax=Mesorhizobium prunaredense TaxID=1631249 RepID=A0A1R3V009_9HYPH|nr:hypothetical protein [Mesorhizobium prunaredense]SIT53230.1 conserved hypothetical protein [Mesorhizobium prunaredense]